MPEELDLEADWAELRQRSPIRIISNRGGDVTSQVEYAAETAQADLVAYFRKKYPGGAPITTEVLSELAVQGALIFMTAWKRQLINLNLSGLLEVVLEGQNLTSAELMGFMRALPLSILTRVATSVVGSATGTHGLVAIEVARREGRLLSYDMGDDNGRTWVKFQHSGGQIITFYLDEPFNLPG